MAKLNFTRSEGFEGSFPRKWIDRELPICPFCRKTDPKWEQARENKFRHDQYHFRCHSCHGEVSILVAAVSKDGINPGQHQLFAKAKKQFAIVGVGT